MYHYLIQYNKLKLSRTEFISKYLSETLQRGNYSPTRPVIGIDPRFAAESEKGEGRRMRKEAGDEH